MVSSRSSYRLGVPIPFAGEFEVVIMIEVCDRRDGCVGPSFLTWNDYERGPGLVWQKLQRERNGALFGVHGLVRFKSA